jgi:hypothetical protein
VTLGVQLFASHRAGGTAQDVLRDLVSTCSPAEQAGYDVVWLAERHGTEWNLCTDPLTVLADLAALTNRIRLGAAVVNISLHHPVRMADQAALVNVLSAGRLELGIGRGFAPRDYERFGLDRKGLPSNRSRWVLGVGGMDPAATNRALFEPSLLRMASPVRSTTDGLPTGYQSPHEHTPARREHAHGPSRPPW